MLRPPYTISPLLRRNAQPALFIFVALDLTKSCLLQICFQCSVRIDGHAIDDLRPFVVFCRFAVCFIADEKDPAGLQHPIDPVSYTHLDVYKRQEW